MQNRVHKNALENWQKEKDKLLKVISNQKIKI
jgi:hypothetical protein